MQNTNTLGANGDRGLAENFVTSSQFWLRNVGEEPMRARDLCEGEEWCVRVREI